MLCFISYWVTGFCIYLFIYLLTCSFIYIINLWHYASIILCYFCFAFNYLFIFKYAFFFFLFFFFLFFYILYANARCLDLRYDFTRVIYSRFVHARDCLVGERIPWQDPACDCLRRRPTASAGGDNSAGPRSRRQSWIASLRNSACCCHRRVWTPESALSLFKGLTKQI